MNPFPFELLSFQTYNYPNDTVGSRENRETEQAEGKKGIER